MKLKLAHCIFFLNQNWQQKNCHPKAFKNVYIQMAFPYSCRRTDEPLIQSGIWGPLSFLSTLDCQKYFSDAVENHFVHAHQLFFKY